MYTSLKTNAAVTSPPRSVWRKELVFDRAQDARSSHVGVGLGNYVVFVPKTPDCNNPELPLSQREKQVLFLNACGLSGPQIADEIGVTANTVSTFKRRILEKLGCRSMSQASVIATAYALGATVNESHACDQVFSHN
ncbi:MAG: helix-turn-helix transcriptional regulator [Hyphomonadaceae bacterium]|nr:helix-turn-helix transcriptional regulator [Hyphomonadaceae bacterium]